MRNAPLLEALGWFEGAVFVLAAAATAAYVSPRGGKVWRHLTVLGAAAAVVVAAGLGASWATRPVLRGRDALKPP